MEEIKAMTESNDESSGVGGIQPDSVGDAHGVDSGQPDLFPPASEGSDSEPDPIDSGHSNEMIRALAGTEISKNLREHWPSRFWKRCKPRGCREPIAG